MPPLSRALLGGLPLLPILLAGCDVAQFEEPEETFEPALAEVRTRSELGAAKSTDGAHWADGYAWAHNPHDASYSPSPSYAFNRAGGAIIITKPAETTGQYEVRFTALSSLLGATSTVQVTAASPDNTYCKPAAPRLKKDAIQVRCFDVATGAAANAAFTVLVLRNYPDLAYAHASQPTGNDYAPPAGASWNVAGPMRIFRLGTGIYHVRFSELVYSDTLISG